MGRKELLYDEWKFQYTKSEFPSAEFVIDESQDLEGTTVRDEETILRENDITWKYNILVNPRASIK